jgi:hypothetical protein
MPRPSVVRPVEFPRAERAADKSNRRRDALLGDRAKRHHIPGRREPPRSWRPTHPTKSLAFRLARPSASNPHSTIFFPYCKRDSSLGDLPFIVKIDFMYLYSAFSDPKTENVLLANAQQ